MNPQPISLLICALGGEGGGVLTEWLVDVARHAGYAMQATSIPGVAQRTGATTYYLEVYPVPMAQLNGKRPVFSLSPVPGALDAIVSSELLETTRQIGNGMATAERTRIISSSSRTLTTQERMQLGDGRADSADFLAVVRAHSRSSQVFDMGAVARECGTVVSAVMLGAIAGSGLFPFSRADYEAVVKQGGKGSQASLRGFAKAFDIVNAAQGQADQIGQMLNLLSNSGAHQQACKGPGGRFDFQIPCSDAPHDRPGPRAPSGLPGPCVCLAVSAALDSGCCRQSAPPIRRATATSPPRAKWRAGWRLWMAFDDIVRVADLKSRASRWRRVRGEVKAQDDDLLKVYDHFKPGAPEFAALLPLALADRVLAWDRRRTAAGKAPWALPLKVGSHSVGGMLALRTLASLRWLRVRGSRYANEQQMIERWLDGVVQGTQRHWQLGHDIALCGRLIKGYGATNERGKDNLLHVLDHLAHGTDAAAASRAVAAAREAALADDAGKALDAALTSHGAPARPVKAQPIRWMRQPRKA
jgi:indolepyruvate ferredoxin oxidoreductase beta subunit